MRKFLTLVAAVTLTLATAGTAAYAGVRLAAAPVSTPTGIQPDGRLAGCVKSGVPAGTPAPLSVRTSTDACGKGYKTVYWRVEPKAIPATVYGTGYVYIARGGAAATVWAKASTSIGSPEGDTTSNTFRASCSAAQAPCVISVKAKATAASLVYPRLLIQKYDISTDAPLGMCEYGDGVDNDGATKLVTALSGVPLGIGGSLDCGSTQVRPASGIVDSIEVPAGRYDIAATFEFKRALSAS